MNFLNGYGTYLGAALKLVAGAAGIYTAITQGNVGGVDNALAGIFGLFGIGSAISTARMRAAIARAAVAAGNP